MDESEEEMLHHVASGFDPVEAWSMVEPEPPPNRPLAWIIGAMVGLGAAVATWLMLVL